MKDNNGVIKNKYGFYWIKDRPHKEELEKYYSEKYYQEAKGSYSYNYSDEELKYIYNKIEQKYSVLSFLEKEKMRPSLLDFGCGEGFTLDFFNKKGWEVLGLDYSEFGCKKFNPHLLNKLTQGDIYEKADELISNNVRFDVVWLTNVLEHVIDPFEILLLGHKLTNNNGVLVIQVPNDFSKVQEYLLKAKKIDKPFWVQLPDHLSYFNKEGLVNICKSAGWVDSKIITDYPIDFSLFIEETNYVKNKSIGPSVHQSRIEIENLLHSISIDKVVKYYEAMADLGIGRQIIGFFKKQL